MSPPIAGALSTLDLCRPVHATKVSTKLKQVLILLYVEVMVSLVSPIPFGSYNLFISSSKEFPDPIKGIDETAHLQLNGSIFSLSATGPIVGIPLCIHLLEKDSSLKRSEQDTFLWL